MSAVEQAVVAYNPNEDTIELTEAQWKDVEDLDKTCKNLYFIARQSGDSHAVALKRPFQAWC